MKKAIITLFVAMVSFSVFAQDSAAASKTSHMKEYLSVEVSVNNASGRVEGDQFIVEGYIYPEGTTSNGTGINEDGSPEFPDVLLGTWTCSGWFATPRDPANTPVGARTVQTFEFDMVNIGQNMIVTYGFEQASLAPIFIRPVVGTSGVYSDDAGVQRQNIIGFNVSGGPNYKSVFVQEKNFNFKDK